MSGDVQPRKRKDKKRKRDSLDRRSEGDLVFSRKQSLQDDEPREQHQGVHGSKMGSDDVHLHVQGDHETGGHWCAKIFFFSLLAILLGLVGLIILENRGLSDLDTPLSESRFSNYFDGWVDEHRESHDEHDPVSASIEEHEHGDEPFEEEEDHSEIDEADDDDDEEKEHDQEEDDEDDEEDTKENEGEEEDDDDATDEVETQTVEEADDTQEEDNQTEEDDDDDNKTVEEAVDESNEDEGEDAADGNDKDDDSNTKEAENNADDDDDDDTEEVVEPIYTRAQRSAQQVTSKQSSTKEEDDDDDEPFEEEDDDGTFESLESVVVDNDAEELLLLQHKARQQQEALKKEEPQPEEEPSSYTSSLAVKIGVGVALALVARLVLIRKNPNTSEPTTEVLMKRRLTIASPEDTFAEDADELLEYDYSEDDILNRDHGAEEEYIEEEVEEEEEIEVTDEEYEEKTEKTKYVPETFEQFHAMYRPKGSEPSKLPDDNGKKEKKESPSKTSIQIPTEPKVIKSLETGQHSEPASSVKPAQLRFSQYSREKTPPPAEPSRSPQPPSAPPPQAQTGVKNVRGYSNEPEEEIEYDDDELYDDEMLDEEEEEDIADDEGDEEDLSDVDDSELMNRLEAKYGRLPAREYDSDEDVDDQSWTKIKSRGGGPQSMDDDAFEEELRRANEEMLRESYNSALTMFESLSQKFPDKPEAFLGKARTLDKLSEIHRSNSKLSEALNAYKRYLAFGEDILNDGEFIEVAQRCVDRMRFMGLNLQAVPVHEMLIERFPNEVSYRNQLAVTYLMVNRLSDAKRVLEEILPRWPTDGFALVHYGFVLKNLNRNLPLAVQYLRSGIDSKAEGTQDGRFYFNLGDGLQRLGRVEEAREVYKQGAALKLFLSEFQRSLYNVNSLRAQPFWTKKETGYEKFLNNIESNWLKIREEGLSVLSAKGDFQDEAENLRDSGDWKQFELFARGQRRRENCLKTPVTCGIIETFPSARFCKRGQVKFSVMHPGTHVWPHCGPTNCRLRAHLGLKVPTGTLIRVANNKRTWQEGKFLVFDDSFEHEVWHNGTSLRLVLIVDVWHPDLTEQQRQSLSPI